MESPGEYKLNHSAAQKLNLHSVNVHTVKKLNIQPSITCIIIALGAAKLLPVKFGGLRENLIFSV